MTSTTNTIIFDKNNIFVNITNNSNCHSDLDFWIRGQKKLTEPTHRLWKDLDKIPMLKKEDCAIEPDRNTTKFVHHLIEKEFYCTNFTKAKFALDPFCSYDYHSIVIEQCNDTTVCINRVGTFDISACQYKDFCESAESRIQYFIDNPMKAVESFLIIGTYVALPIIGAISYFYCSTNFPLPTNTLGGE